MNCCPTGDASHRWYFDMSNLPLVWKSGAVCTSSGGTLRRTSATSSAVTVMLRRLISLVSETFWISCSQTSLRTCSRSSMPRLPPFWVTAFWTAAE